MEGRGAGAGNHQRASVTSGRSMEAGRRVVLGLVALGALAAFAGGIVALVGHFALFFARARFALDLEWMEGGLLLHALRFAEGKNIYVPPSLEFVPYLYTPLYPALLAALSKVTGLSYLLGRVVSILSFAGALALLVAAAVRAAGGIAPASSASSSHPQPSLRSLARLWRSPARVAALAIGIGGAGAVAASFVATGGFYDLVRADSLLLFLAAAALALGMRAADGGSYRLAAAAGLLIALAFFTKQTASILGISLGLGLLLASWRRGLVYGAVAAVTLGLGLLLLNLTSDGWFWTYVYKLHQSHEFYPDRAFVKTPQHLWKLAGPLYIAWLLSGLALLRARALHRSDAVHAAVSLGGFVSACIGFGTQWAHDNAFIPAIYFPAFTAALWTARLATQALPSENGSPAAADSEPTQGRTPRTSTTPLTSTDTSTSTDTDTSSLTNSSTSRPHRRLSPVLVALSALALALQAVRTALPDRRRLAPTPRDHTAARHFLTHLRSLEGPLFIPFHPYYTVLVGQPPHLHRMGVWDVTAMLGRPAGLDEALASGRFSHVVLDWKSQPGEWPTLAGRYRDVHQFADGVDAVRSFSGADTSPRRLLARQVAAPPLPAGGARLFDFETGYAGFSGSGQAFGTEPAPASPGLFGRGAADSRRFGPEATGALTSPPFPVTRPRLRFLLDGAKDPGLRVLLLDGAEVSHTATPSGAGTRTIDWDVSRLRGRSATLVIDDRSAAGGLAVDEIVSF